MTTKTTSAAEVPGFFKLTPREQQFVQHPDVYRDPKKAALECGYSTSTIEKRAHSMRQRLMRFIQPQFEAKFAKLHVDRQRIEEELAAIGFIDVTEYQESLDIEMPDGGFQTVVVWKHPDSLTPEQRRAIKRIEWDWTTLSDGTQIQSDRPGEIYFFSKEKALHELAGLFSDVAPKNPAEEEQSLFDNLEPADKEHLIRLHMKARRLQAAKEKPALEGEHVEPKPLPRIAAPVPRSRAQAPDDDRRSKGDRREAVDAGSPAGDKRVGSRPRVAARVDREPPPVRPEPPVDDVGEDSDAGYSELPD